MKLFAQLFTALDQTTKTLDKINSLKEYFEQAQDTDKLWAMALLSHRRPKRTVNAGLLAQWASELSLLPSWLFEESYHIVGDLAETITLMLPPAPDTSDETLTYWIHFIRSLEKLSLEEKKERILWAWSRLNETERFVFNKLITGGFRIGVSQQLMVKALSRYSQVKENVLAHRLMGNWSPDEDSFQHLIFSGETQDISRPYPFYLAYALEQEIDSLGEPSQWQAEWKWDGIRGQVVVRDKKLFVWSRGEELVTDKYPEYAVMTDLLPDGTVMDGEILPFKDNKPLTFQHLQTRIGRKTLSAKLLKDVPVCFVTYDLLEWRGEDVRTWRLEERRKKLEEIVMQNQNPALRLSPVIEFANWNQLAEMRLRSREFLSEGIMLKRKDSTYRDGRRKGDWWKWKVDPFTVDAVMIYAMNGHGRRANLFTDYTFAVWDNDQLVPFTKAYSGLTDEEILKVDRWVKQNTIERFGPVRSVKPELVFELAFEGIQKSTRHKSGIALRFPRIKRWRTDKPASEADHLSDLLNLLGQ
jgi:DNA ligase-1